MKHKLLLAVQVMIGIFFTSGAHAMGTAPPPPARSGAPLSSTILLLNASDYDRCLGQVQQASQLGNRRVQFLPTLKFRLNAQHQVQSYCFPQSQNQCVPIDETVMTTYQRGLNRCFQAANAFHLGVSILVHLDDAGPEGYWRNLVGFDPMASYDGKTYLDTALIPIIRALNASMNADAKIDFSLAGEMGASVFSFPDSYAQAAAALKQLNQHSGLRIGVSFNFNKVTGGVPAESITNRAHLQDLLNSADFIGISNYHSVPVPVRPTDFDLGIQSFMAELAQISLQVPDTKELQFSEVAIGGGTAAADGTETIAKTPEEAAQAPYMGVGAPLNPWVTTEMRDFRLAYHEALTQFLHLQPSRWRVGAAFLWSMASWDPQGLYGSDLYRDDRIVKWIHDYNLQTLR